MYWSDSEINHELNCIPKNFLPGDFNGDRQYLINGEILTHAQGVEVFSPIKIMEDNEVNLYKLGEYSYLDKEEALAALAAAKKAYDSGNGTWPQMPLVQRIECMQNFLQHMRKLKERFAILEMWEIAKPYNSCLDEFERTVKYIEDTIASLQDLDKESSHITTVNNFVAQIRRAPLGIVLCMGPFNYPLNETFAMLIPALLMGNTLVVKPPKYGALCTVSLFAAFAESFPAGTVNIINGDGEQIISPIIQSGEIAVLAFIGSTQVANLLIGQHPRNNRLRTILGLEAKNPAFVLKDARLSTAADECVKGALEFNGQRCTAIKHIWVDETVTDKFLQVLSDNVDNVKCGMPWEEGVTITPLAEEAKSHWLKELVEDACEKGAHIVNHRGGKSAGNMFYPTVLYPVTPDMKVYHVEQFGPLLPVSSFTDISNIKDYLNSTDFGQQASIFSENPDYTIPLIDILVNQVSRINLNAQCRRGPDVLPFTGRKDSGEGTLSVSDALRAFSLRSLVVAHESGRELFFDCLKKNESRFLRI